MKRRYLVLALCASMILSMAACGGSQNAAPASTAAQTEAPAAETEAPAAETEAPAAENEAAEEAETEAAAAEAPAAGEILTNEQLEALAEEGMQTTIEAEPLEISVACSGTVDGTVMGDAFYAAMAAIEKWTGGNVKIAFYPGGQLGGDMELIEGLQMGSLNVMSGAPTSQVSMMPELAVLDIAGLYTDLEKANSVVKDFYDQFEGVYNAKGLHLASLYVQSFRILSSNKPAVTAADLQGLNIRTQENPYHMAFWKALGTNPTPLAFGELYIALQQGMLDAEENPVASIVGAKLSEVQKYIVKTNHIPFVSTLVTNNDWYQGMSDGQRLAFDQFAEYIERYMLAGTAQDEARLFEICENDFGIEVTEVSDEIKELFPAAAQVVIDQMKADGKVDPAFIDGYVAASGFVAP